MQNSVFTLHSHVRQCLIQLDEINNQINEYKEEIKRAARWLDTFERMTPNIRVAAVLDANGNLRRCYDRRLFVSIGVSICAIAVLCAAAARKL